MAESSVFEGLPGNDAAREAAAGPPEPGDTVLIERSRRGDHAAYSLLVERYTPLLMRVTLRLLRDRAQAEDACQESFLRAYMRLETYDLTYKFSTWLGAIASHHCLRLLTRRDWEHPDADLALLHEAFLDDDPELQLLLKEQAEAVRRAVAMLPARYRQALELRHWHELSYAEIATITGQSLGAIKTQLRRARAMLAEALTAGENLHALY
jgi:RNA polymerase sigma-70 factor (ECF subfamily)